MNDPQREQVMDVLVRAIELPTEQREEFIERACGGDKTLRAEVSSLLQKHPTKTITPVRPGASDPAAFRKRVNPVANRRPSLPEVGAMKQWCWAVGALLLLLSAITWWIRGQIQTSLRADLRDDLLSMLDADVRIIRDWVADQQDLANAWAAHAGVRSSTQQLVEVDEGSTASTTRDALRQSSVYPSLLKSLTVLKLQHGLSAANIFSRSGTCLAHTRQDMVGAPVAPAGGGYLRRVMLGETIFVKPTKEKLYVVGFDPQLEGPVMGIAAPIRDEHDGVIGGLALAFPTEHEYSEALAFTRSGTTDETYAFDRDLTMLSSPHRPQRLVEMGLLSDDSKARLNVQVRVPVRTGETYTVAGQPPTLMAAAAVDRGGGINLEGYLNYLGEPVIGASRWLSEFDFGLCKEISVKEAFRPVHTVEWFTLGFMGLTGLVAGLAVFTSLRNVQLHQVLRDKRQIGPYTLQEKIGEGGMGTVYRCQHALLQRPTAMKLLDGQLATPDSLARFEREVQIASELTHPHTVQIYDFGRTDDNIFYIAMELLPGLDLTELVSHSGPQPAARVIHILRQTSQALQEAHHHGLIHRDIKPANIMLCERGGYFDFVKVLDYGLARSFIDDPQNELTRDGIVRGTPGYIAPERLSGKEDIRGDIFSVGAVGYFLLSGRPAYSVPRDVDAFQAVLQQQPPPASTLDKRDIPPALAELIFRCLAPAPVDRPSQLDQVLEQLDRLAESHPWSQADAEQWWKEFASEQHLTTKAGRAG